MYYINDIRVFNTERIKDREAISTYEEYFSGKKQERIAMILQVLAASRHEFGDIDSPGILLGVVNQLMGDVGLNRPRTEYEVADILKSAPTWFDKSMIGDAMSDRAMSIGFDIGLCLGERLVALNKKLAWKLVTKPKNCAEFGRVCVSGFRLGGEFDPLRIGPVVVKRCLSTLDFELWYREFLGTWRQSASE
jgi:hypothetical protein